MTYVLANYEICLPFSCVFPLALVIPFVLQKITKKLHLSKAKHSKFNESGQLLVFYLISIVWGIDIILR